MSDEKDRIVMVESDGRSHPLAKGLIAGAAVGVGLGMLLAPRRGSELRGQVKVQVNNLASKASTGYHHAMDTSGQWAHRGYDVYVVCRDKLAHGAHETRRYVREVTDAVTQRRGVWEARPPDSIAPAQRSTSIRVPISTASAAQAGQAGRIREQASPQSEARKEGATKETKETDLKAV
jgi:gas vesicle protein